MNSITGIIVSKERKQKTGHYRQEGIIIEPSESRAAASEVSINSEGQSVPRLLKTYSDLVTNFHRPDYQESTV